MNKKIDTLAQNSYFDAVNESSATIPEPKKVFERYVNFYTDFAFKKLFGTEANKELLIGFLNALLEGREVVKDVTYLNPEHIGDQRYDRQGYFDVYCKNDKGNYFIVEMQRGRQGYFVDRSVFYSSLAIRDQAPKGGWDYRLKNVYTIAFMDFKIEGLEAEEDFCHEVRMVDVRSNKIFFDKLTYFYFEMPKFNKEENELESLIDKWLYAIKNLNSLYERPKVLQEKVFESFFETAEIAKFKPEERFVYEDSRKRMWDEFSKWQTAVKEGRALGEAIGRAEGHAKGLAEGLAAGRAEGRAAGRAEGRAEGREEGKLQKSREMAKAMLLENVPLSVISKVSNLSEDEIKLL